MLAGVFGLPLVEEYATVEKRPAICVEGHREHRILCILCEGS